MIIKIQFLLNKDILSDGEKYSFQWVKASFPMTGSYVSDAQYRRNVLFIGVLRSSDYRITGLQTKYAPRRGIIWPS